MNSEPYKLKGSWFVDTPNGVSGPWNTRDAAQAAADDNFTTANMLHNAVKSK